MDKWFRSNIVIKVVSVILALMLWLVVNYDQHSSTPPVVATDNSITIYDVPLQVKYDDKQFELVDAPSTVTLILKGSPAQMAAFSGRLLPNQYDVFVDLTHVTKGSRLKVPVQIKGLPGSISAQALPSEVEITLAEKERKEMNVSTELMGDLADGYTTGKPIISPARVYVKAAKKQLDEVAFVKAFVNIEGQSKPIKQSYALKALDKDGNQVNVNIQPSVVEVSVPVNSPTKTVPFHLNISGEPPKGYAVAGIESDLDKVSIYGPKGSVDAMDVYQGPTIDLSGYRADRVLQLQIPLAPGLLKVEPDQVEVTVQIVPSKTVEYVDIPIATNGLKDGWQLAFPDKESDRVAVQLEGAPSILDKIKETDIQAFIDVSNLSDGEHRVPVQFNLPQFVRVDGQPPDVTVTISKKSVEQGNPNQAKPDTLH